MPRKLAIITTHPIQYNAPWFKMLAQENRLQLRVFYTWGESVLQQKYDPGFKRNIQWDIPLLEGYDYEFVENVATHPGSHHYKGIDNPVLIQRIQDWGAEAILIFGWNFKSHMACIRFFHHKIPVLFRGDSTLLDEAGFSVKGWIRKWVLRWVYRHIDAALYTGVANKAYFKKYGLKAHQLIFTPHAVDNERFSRQDDAVVQRAVQFRQQLGITEQAPVVLFAGKLEPKKNPFYLLQLARVLSDLPFQFVLVGNGVLETELKTAAQQLPNVHFLEFQNQQDMPAIYQMATFFVLPSVGPGETWGLAINEAMSAGCAVLASNRCGAAQDLLIEGKTGWIIDPHQPETAARILRTCNEQADLLNQVRLNGRNHISNYSFSSICQSITQWMNPPQDQ